MAGVTAERARYFWDKFHNNGNFSSFEEYARRVYGLDISAENPEPPTASAPPKPVHRSATPDRSPSSAAPLRPQAAAPAAPADPWREAVAKANAARAEQTDPEPLPTLEPGWQAAVSRVNATRSAANGS